VGGETLLGLDEDRATATSYMPAQSVAHIVIMLFILAGNIGFILERRRKGEKGLWR